MAQVTVKSALWGWWFFSYCGVEALLSASAGAGAQPAPPLQLMALNIALSKCKRSSQQCSWPRSAQLSAGVMVVTEGRGRALTPRDHRLAGGEFSRREWFGEITGAGRIGYAGKSQRVHINPLCIWSALWKPWLAETPAWLELWCEQCF